MTTEQTIKSLTDLNLAKRWTKGPNLDRMYLTPDAKRSLAGLEVTTYGTGNVRSANLNGEQISNSRARKLLSTLGGQIWFDVPTGKWMTKGSEWDRSTLNKVVAAAKAALDEWLRRA